MNHNQSKETIEKQSIDSYKVATNPKEPIEENIWNAYDISPSVEFRTIFGNRDQARALILEEDIGKDLNDKERKLKSSCFVELEEIYDLKPRTAERCSNYLSIYLGAWVVVKYIGVRKTDSGKVQRVLGYDYELPE